MKRLPSLFVILLSCSAALLGFLWMKERNIRADMERQNQELLVDVVRQTEFLQERTNRLYRDILLGIEEEVANHGKTLNLGMKDTTELIHKGAKALLTSDYLKEEEVDHWSAFLQAVYTQIISPNYEGPVSDFSVSLSTTEEQQKLQVLEREFEMLELINTRIGVAAFWIRKRTLIPSQVHRSTLTEGQLFEAELLIMEDEKYWLQSREPTSFFETSMGTIKLGPTGRPMLTIPTEGLLRPDEYKKLVSFEVTVSAISPYRGYDTLKYSGTFWVVGD
ncbi:MAG: hypothetical protein AAGI38_00625 [Bacteroidota bacterium]